MDRLTEQVTTMRRPVRNLLQVIVAVALSACAGMPGREPLQVTVADIDSIPSDGLEMGMMVKLRVQNPNDSPVDYDGVYVKVIVQDKTFATGVSDEKGTVPRFGESVIGVPVTLSMLRVGLAALGMLSGGGMATDKVHYKMEGKLSGPLFGSNNFSAQGDLTLPGAASQ